VSLFATKAGSSLSSPIDRLTSPTCPISPLSFKKFGRDGITPANHRDIAAFGQTLDDVWSDEASPAEDRDRVLLYVRFPSTTHIIKSRGIRQYQLRGVNGGNTGIRRYDTDRRTATTRCFVVRGVA
jgi:hypothetical protein